MPQATPASLPGPSSWKGSSPPFPALSSALSPLPSPSLGWLTTQPFLYLSWVAVSPSPREMATTNVLLAVTRPSSHHRGGARADGRPSPQLAGQKGLLLFCLAHSGMGKPRNSGPWGEWPTRRARCHSRLCGDSLLPRAVVTSQPLTTPSRPTPPCLGRFLAVRTRWREVKLGMRVQTNEGGV